VGAKEWLVLRDLGPARFARRGLRCVPGEALEVHGV